MAKIGIIGGTGLYDPEILRDARSLPFDTRYGKPSDVIVTGMLGGHEIFVLPRHGSHHAYNPTNVPYRANIQAMKDLGVTHVLAPTAVGSLREDYKPGDIVLIDQFIDRTTRRQQTFYDGEGEDKRVCHINVAEPTCRNLRKLLVESAESLGISYQYKGTIVVIEGPRFSTRAESNLFRGWGADLIGMTMVPEAVLAREAEMCYASIATVTDYDAWKEQSVTAKEVIETMGKNKDQIRKLLEDVIPRIPEERDCGCKDALKDSVM